MINGAVLLILGGILVAALYGLRATPRARRTPPPIVTDRRRPCDTTGCGMLGWIVMRRRDGDTAHVCAGCVQRGEALGWWAS